VADEASSRAPAVCSAEARCDSAAEPHRGDCPPDCFLNCKPRRALRASDGFYVRGSLVSGVPRRRWRASPSSARIVRASSRFRAGEPGVSIAIERRRFSTSSGVILFIAPQAMNRCSMARQQASVGASGASTRVSGRLKRLPGFERFGGWWVWGQRRVGRDSRRCAAIIMCAGGGVPCLGG